MLTDGPRSGQEEDTWRHVCEELKTADKPRALVSMKCVSPRPINAQRRGANYSALSILSSLTKEVLERRYQAFRPQDSALSRVPSSLRPREVFGVHRSKMCAPSRCICCLLISCASFPSRPLHLRIAYGRDVSLRCRTRMCQGRNACTCARNLGLVLLSPRCSLAPVIADLAVYGQKSSLNTIFGTHTWWVWVCVGSLAAAKLHPRSFRRWRDSTLRGVGHPARKQDITSFRSSLDSYDRRVA